MKTGHELTGLIKFFARDEWKRHLDEVVAEHFGPTSKTRRLAKFSTTNGQQRFGDVRSRTS